MKLINLLKFALIFIATLLGIFSAPLALAAPRTSTQFNISGKGGLNIIPYMSWNQHKLIVDFESSNLGGLEYIYYNLNYNAGDNGILRGVEGKFTPDKKDFRRFAGLPYIRKEILMGTCSKNVCVYDYSPKKVNITVKSKYWNSPTISTQVLTINQ